MGEIKVDRRILRDKWLLSLKPEDRWTWLAVLAEVDVDPRNGDYLIDLGYQKTSHLARKTGVNVESLEQTLSAALTSGRAKRDSEFPFVIRVKKDLALELTATS